MKTTFSIARLVCLSLVAAAVCSPIAWADKLTFKDGTEIEAIVKKVERGEVTAQIGEETKIFSILDIAGMEFDAPRGSEETPRLPGEHFLSSMEAKSVVGHIEAVE